MPGLVTPDEGQLELLANCLITDDFTDYTYTLDLYQNDYTPVRASTFADFTVCNFTGYAAKTIERSDWANPTTVNDEATTASNDNPYTWTCGAVTNTVYGYLVRSTQSGKVLWAEQFADEVVLTDGAQLLLNLNVNLFGQNS